MDLVPIMVILIYLNPVLHQQIFMKLLHIQQNVCNRSNADIAATIM